MVKLQHISWATILLILSPVSINISLASTILQEAESTAIAMETYQLAQQQEGDDEMLDALQKRQEKIGGGLGKIQKLTETESEKTEPQPEEQNPKAEDGETSKHLLPPTIAFRILTVGLPATILVFLIGKPIVRGILGVFKSNYQENFGKPKVPEGSLNRLFRIHGVKCSLSYVLSHKSNGLLSR